MILDDDDDLFWDAGEWQDPFERIQHDGLTMLDDV